MRFIAEEGLVEMIMNLFNEEDLVEYGSVSLSILLKITAKIGENSYIICCSSIN